MACTHPLVAVVARCLELEQLRGMGGLLRVQDGGIDDGGLLLESIAPAPPDPAPGSECEAPEVRAALIELRPE